MMQDLTHESYFHSDLISRTLAISQKPPMSRTLLLSQTCQRRCVHHQRWCMTVALYLSRVLVCFPVVFCLLAWVIVVCFVVVRAPHLKFFQERPCMLGNITWSF